MPAEREVNMNEILKKCFLCLMDNGLEKTSTRLFSAYTGLKTSSLYYWFKDKDEIIIKSTEYGLNFIIKNSLNLVINNIRDFEKLFTELIKSFKEYIKSLKLIIHIASSPTYSKILIGTNGNFEKIYYDFAMQLSNYFNIDYITLRPVINLFVATITDCAIWEQWEQFEEQIKYLLGRVLELKNEAERK